MASTRLTIRLSATLAARLAAATGTDGTLADTVRHALEVYLRGENLPRQTPGSHTADAADTLAAALAAITTRLAHIEERLTALEAVADSDRHKQPRVAGKSVRKYTLRRYSFFFKEIEAKSAEFSTPS